MTLMQEYKTLLLSEGYWRDNRFNLISLWVTRELINLRRLIIRVTRTPDYGKRLPSVSTRSEVLKFCKRTEMVRLNWLNAWPRCWKVNLRAMRDRLGTGMVYPAPVCAMPLCIWWDALPSAHGHYQPRQALWCARDLALTTIIHYRIRLHSWITSQCYPCH